jgi:hypothetical protein
VTESTVTERPPFGSVEMYAGLLRRTVRRVENLDGCALAIVAAIAVYEGIDAAEKVRLIRNLAEATELVGGERDQAELEMDELRARVAELEARPGWHAKGCLGATGQPCTCPQLAEPS